MTPAASRPPDSPAMPRHALASPCHVRSWYPDRDGEGLLAALGAGLALADRVERGDTEAPVTAGGLRPPVAQPDALAGELEPLPQPLRVEQAKAEQRSRPTLQAAGGPSLATPVQAGGGGNGGRMRTPRHARPLGLRSLRPRGARLPGRLADSWHPHRRRDPDRTAGMQRGHCCFALTPRLQSVDAGNPHQIQFRRAAHRRTGRPMGRRGGPVAPPHAMPGGPRTGGRAGSVGLGAEPARGDSMRGAGAAATRECRCNHPHPLAGSPPPDPTVRARSSPARATATTIRKRGLRHVRDDGLRDCGALLPRAARANVLDGATSQHGNERVTMEHPTPMRERASGRPRSAARLAICCALLAGPRLPTPACRPPTPRAYRASGSPRRTLARIPGPTSWCSSPTTWAGGRLVSTAAPT